MTDEMQTQAPLMSDPGGDGWAAEPRVSQAEISLYGDHAAIVRLLGQAAVDSGNAYSLACKRVAEEYLNNEDDRLVYVEVVTQAWNLHQQAVAVHRTVADKALAQRLRVQERIDDDRGAALTSGLG